MPCRAPEWAAAPAKEHGSCDPTPALDWQAAPVWDLAAEVASSGETGLALLQLAHRLIAERVRPVYSLDDLQPASRTLRLGRGSCSQRFAVLEAVARANQVPTRSRGLVVDGRFWYPRFPMLRWAVPDLVLLAWPEFQVSEEWVSASDLYGRISAGEVLKPFTNRGGETLFDAVAVSVVDWEGATSAPGTCSMCDMSGHVRHDLGTFESRDALFAATGHTFCPPTRRVLGPLLGRWAAGAK